MSAPNVKEFAEKYLLAVETDINARRESGTTGLELEWNVYDSYFRPIRNVPTGEGEMSFVDWLREKHIPAWLESHNKPEVYNWMSEWMTRPYYAAAHTVYESWLLEALLLNALASASADLGERLYAYHGNVMYPVEVGHDDIPRGWDLARRRYLQRCVDRYGSTLATAGTHVNVSLPETLLSWDFMHQPDAQRVNGHLDAYKNRVYIEITRLMRAFSSLMIAITASTPLRTDLETGEPLVLLTEVDSNRSLIFPNDRNLDVPYLYRSYEDYVSLSYDLVRRGVRFGNNNYTPVRARSSAEPVERIISLTSGELEQLYKRGLYPQGAASMTLEEMASQIEHANLRARIDLPMSRVELRTDEGSHNLELDVAHLTLVELLAIRFYMDPEFARAFRYDVEDIARARRNESIAATYGLRGEIENPFTAKPIQMRSFLGWTLEQVRPLAQALGRAEQLEPLVAMYDGAPNAAEQIRARVREEIGDGVVVPPEVLKMLAEEREQEVRHAVQKITVAVDKMNGEGFKLRELLQAARADARSQPATVRIDFHGNGVAAVDRSYPDTTSEVVGLAKELIGIPSVTNCPEERLEEVARAAHFIRDYLCAAGVEVRTFDEGRYPALLAHFPGQLKAPVMLSGHFDVVEPRPDDSQFEPRVEGDYLWGRGSADMKTVVATYMVWMKDQMKADGPKPAINLLLVGNEENGEGEPMGTPHVLEALQTELNYIPSLMIAGERTGEQGDELFGKVCAENRGVVRLKLVATGKAGHTGVAAPQADIADQLVEARNALPALLADCLTLEAEDGFRSSYRFPFLLVGERGVYNITATRGELGLEVRPIPQDDVDGLIAAVEAYADAAGLALEVDVHDAGIACDPENVHLKNLLAAVEEASGAPAPVGKKLPATSARFAPQGNGVVWGETGIGPHADDERHYIPSIQGYYDALNALAKRYKK